MLQIKKKNFTLEEENGMLSQHFRVIITNTGST